MLPRIAAEIAEHGGWIPFARFMELALQAYYGGPAAKFGAPGDFVTAPELGNLFGRTLARQFCELEPHSVLEFGAGTGALAETLLGDLDCEYLILETSPSLRERQRLRLGDRARWIERLPERFRGVVIANEVVDAMPVNVLRWSSESIKERGVTLDRGQLAWIERPAAGEVLSAAQSIHVTPPYLSEINLAARAWMRSLASTLEQGAIFIIDYGFAGPEYYHPQRSGGTLMSHHRHCSHDDVLARPGEQDITAHVDFSALARAAEEGGLEVLGYATLAQFLVNCGITDVLGEANVENALHYAPLASQAQRLLSPAEMGELFKVLALGRGASAPLRAFARGDRSHTL